MYVKYTLALVIHLLTDFTKGQTTTQVRLVDGNNTAGRVEVLHEGEWRQVCDDCFDVPEAWAICQMLNFPNGGVPLFGQWSRSASFWIDDLTCECSQTIDTGCMFSQWGLHDCSASEAVGVACYDGAPSPQPTCAPPASTEGSNCIRSPNLPSPALQSLSFSALTSADTNEDGDIRLIGPPAYPGIGCVEFYYNGTWGSVCDDYLDTNNARVICTQLGYDPNVAHTGIRAEFNNYRQNTSTFMVLGDIRCDGSETRIDQCPRSPYGIHNCTENEKLCVSCQNPNEAIPELPVPYLDCNNGTISASFSRTLHSGLTEGHISLLSGFCPNATMSTDVNFVTINIPFDRCNTRIRTNETHIIYYNTIRYNYTDTSNVITRVYISEIEVSCAFPRDLDVSNGVHPLPRTVAVEAPGQYDITLLFFLNNSFNAPVIGTPVNLTIGEWLNAALTLEAIRTDLKLVVSNCVATPSTNQYDAVNYPLFINKCERDNTLTFLPLNSTSFGFRYQTFKFPYHDLVYIHCDAFVCLQSEKYEQCDRSCNSQNRTGTGRRRRNTDDDTNRRIYHLRSPPLRLLRQERNNYVITDLNVTVTGVLRKEEPLNKTIKTTDIPNTIAGGSNSQPTVTTTVKSTTTNQHLEVTDSNENNQSADGEAVQTVTSIPKSSKHVDENTSSPFATVTPTNSRTSDMQREKKMIPEIKDVHVKSEAKVIGAGGDFNYDKPFVAGLGNLLQNSSKMLTSSYALILLCLQVVI